MEQRSSPTTQQHQRDNDGINNNNEGIESDNNNINDTNNSSSNGNNRNNITVAVDERPLLNNSDDDSSSGGNGTENVTSLPPFCCASCPCDCFLWTLLICICFLTFGLAWVFDIPGAIQTPLTEWFGGPEKYTKSMNLALYSVYSWPNTVLALFGGYLIDRYLGIRAASLLFCTSVFFGQVIFALGVQFRAYPMAVIGRFIYGLGGETLTVAQTAWTVRWFEGRQLALAIGIVFAFTRIGSATNFAVTPKLANLGVPFSIWFGTAMCALSMVFCLIAYILDKKGEHRVPRKSVKAEADGPISLKHIRYFSSSTWLVSFIVIFFYMGVSAFFSIASDIMQHSGNHYDADTASSFLAIPTFVGIFAAVLWGRLLDKRGHSLKLTLISCVSLVLTYLWFLALAMDWIKISPVAIMIFFGFAYSLGSACLWPMVSLVVEKRMVSTAYGLVTSMQNVGMAILPTAIGGVQDAGGIQDTKWAYIIPIIMIMACAGISIILTLILFGVDHRATGGMLSASAARREILLKQRSARAAHLNDVTSSPIDGDNSDVITSASSSDRYSSGEKSVC